MFYFIQQYKNGKFLITVFTFVIMINQYILSLALILENIVTGVIDINGCKY